MSTRCFRSLLLPTFNNLLINASLVATLLLSSQANAAPEDSLKYGSYREAWSIGAGFYNARKFAEATLPLEAALKMAPDDRTKLKAHEALIACYRLLPDTEKMMTTVEYVVANSKRKSGLSLHRRGFISYLHQRGKVKEAVRRYEDRLKKDPEDFVSLFLLSEIYTTVETNPKRATEIITQLNKVAPVEKDDPTALLKQANLARQYVRARDYKNGAEQYLMLAEKDDKLAGYYLKEAAFAQLKMGQKQLALQTARDAVKAGPDPRNEQLTYFWNRMLGDFFLEHGTPQEAIPLLEKALTLTKIDGYL